jgi:hypothetical protein
MTPTALLQDLNSHLATNIRNSDIELARRQFGYLGYAKVPFLAPDSVKSAIAGEVNHLIDTASTRRDLRFAETDNTPRRMRNVSRSEIAELGTVIREVYLLPAMLEAMGRVVGEQVHPCPYPPEQYVITFLERDGDTHGWHWDDYSFALVWVVECPPVSDGGFVQCVPGTSWDKQHPAINRALVNRPIYSIELFPGDLYLMRTNSTLHRVYPVRNGKRKIINMGYASTSDLSRSFSHETMDTLWANSPMAGV